MSAANIVGYVAALFSVIAFAPQAWKVIKTRDTSGLATSMWILEVVAFGMWIVYGALLDEWPIVIPNALCFLIAGFILVMKLVSHPTKNKIADAIDPAA